MHQYSTRHTANNSVTLKQSQTHFYGMNLTEYQESNLY